MIVWTGAALAAEGRLDVIAGVRTAPDAALEQPAEWQPEFEPVAVGALFGSVSARRGVLWGAFDASAWGVVPEPDAIQFSATPRAGVSVSAASVRADLAGRYDLQIFPYASEATSGRTEGFGRLSLDGGTLLPEFSIEAIDRRYPFEPDWSFLTIEPAAGLAIRPDGPGWARLTGGWQHNQTMSDYGSQLRLTGELGYGTSRWDLWSRYRYIIASSGDLDDAARSRFTPLGDYASDADALSAGGFTQHRLELGASVDLGEWQVRSAALGRVRLTGAEGSYDRTLHAQVDVEREITDSFSMISTAGTSVVGLVGGKGFFDLYAWAGLSWRPRRDRSLGGEESH